MAAAFDPFGDKTDAHYEPREHLKALHRTLTGLNLVRDELDAAIKVKEAEQPSEGGPLVRGEHQIVDDYIRQAYDDAAYSHTAVASLAAMFEGIYRHEFGAMAVIDAANPILRKEHRRAGLPTASFWNPTKHVDREGRVLRSPNVQRGAVQILEAIGVLASLPADFTDLTEVLFVYRNNALHNGYEWIVQKRRGFVQMLREKNREGWFDKATTSNHPWLITMSDRFVQRCFDVAEITVEKLIAARWKHKNRGRRLKLLPTVKARLTVSPATQQVRDMLEQAFHEPWIFMPLRKRCPRTEIP